MGDLNNIFNPGTIALIGASDREGSPGRIALTNLLQAKDRRIFPVNPNRKAVLGHECFQHIGGIADPIDCAVIATPAREVPGVVEECGKAGIGGAVIFSAGFQELGEEGKLLEQRIIAARKRYGMRVLGPNCMGFVRPNAGLNATFMRTNPPPGHIAFISQSGALDSALLDWAIAKDVGFSMFASLGAMIDLDFGDFIDFLGQDDDTRSILLYMESVGNAKKFMSAARAFAVRKPIIVVKPGRYMESAKTAGYLAGAMAGDDAVYEAAFKRVGVVRVKEFADLISTAEILDSRKLPWGPRLAIVTGAGGQGVMAADALIDLGGELAKLCDETIERLSGVLPTSWSKKNPVNVLGDADASRYGETIRICLNDPGVDGVLVIYVPMDSAPPEEVAQAVIDNAKDPWKPVIAAWMGAEKVRASMKMFARTNTPGYQTPEGAVKAYVHMYRCKRNLDLLYETPGELPVQQVFQADMVAAIERIISERKHLRGVIKKAIGEERTILNEKESKEFVAVYGIPAIPPSITGHVEEAVAVAREIGYPVALKVVSSDIVCRTDVGGVALGIRSDEELRQAYRRMAGVVKERAPKALIEGIAVERMIEDIDYELMLGSKKDKDFGSVILFGTGGAKAELINDFSIGFPPLNRTLAKRLMEETKAYSLIQGWRGKAPVDLDELESILELFSYLVVDFPEIEAIDINPLAVRGGKVCATDARIILDKEYGDGGSLYSHLVITPYPIRFVTSSTLADGTEIVLRPIRPEDEALQHELVSTISRESLRTRFFGAFPKPTHDWLFPFCNIDYDRHIAMVAEIKEGEARKIIGVARLIMDPDFNSGVFALLVHDRFQRKGIGQKLMEMLARIGRWKGLHEIYGEVLTENDNMLDLCKKLGYTTKWLPQGITRVVLPL